MTDRAGPRAKSLIAMLGKTQPAAERNRAIRPITALCVFFMVGAAISLIAATSLLYPNSFFEPMWRLNPRAHEDLVTLGRWAVLMSAMVSLYCAAAVGLWRRSRWGYVIAIVLMAFNLVGDLTNVLLGIEPRAIIGVPIASAILACLLMNTRVRKFFASEK